MSFSTISGEPIIQDLVDVVGSSFEKLIIEKILASPFQPLSLESKQKYHLLNLLLMSLCESMLKPQSLSWYICYVIQIIKLWASWGARQ